MILEQTDISTENALAAANDIIERLNREAVCNHREENGILYLLNKNGDVIGEGISGIGSTAMFAPLKTFMMDFKLLLNDLAYITTNSHVAVVNTDADAVITALDGGDTPVTTYNVTTTLSHCTSSNSSASIAHNTSYIADLTADSGYSISSVTVTMGGTDITSTAYNSGSGRISIPYATGNIVIAATATVPSVSYTIMKSLTHCASSNGASSVASGAQYATTLTADTGYTLGTVAVAMGGTDITSAAYNSATHEINIGSVTGNIVITATATANTYTVTNTLSYCSTSNNASTATHGTAYSATLTADTDYTISSVTVTMGGMDITASAYNSGTISIASVTGNIVITAIAQSAGPALTSISASFNSGGDTITEYNTLDSLKQYLTVTASYDDSSTSTVNSGDYTLSGTLAVGTSTITVSYSGKTTTFTVTVSVLNTEPVIIENDSAWTSTGEPVTKAGHSRTKLYEYDIDLSALRASSKYDATNGYMTAQGSVFKIVYYFVNTDSVSGGGSNKNVIFIDNTYIGYMSVQTGGEKSFYDPKENTGMLSGSRMKLGFTVFTAGIDDSYAYFKSSGSGVMPIGVNEGDIVFAGRNTPYYGKKNISEVSAT